METYSRIMDSGVENGRCIIKPQFSTKEGITLLFFGRSGTVMSLWNHSEVLCVLLAQFYNRSTVDEFRES